MAGEEIAARARALVGTRFRPQGRSVSEGLDCIGLAALAIGIHGCRRNYSLRGGDLRALEEGLVEAGLLPTTVSKPGDVLVMHAGPGQLHLGILTGSGIVHADAGLRRVVERPGGPEWPVLSVWRLNGKVG